jgi:hypothetical protein
LPRASTAAGRACAWSAEREPPFSFLRDCLSLGFREGLEYGQGLVMVRVASMGFAAALLVAPVAAAPARDAQSTRPAAAAPAKPPGKLTEKSQLAIIRFVDGEFAHAVRPIPWVKKGFRIHVGQPLNQAALRKELRTHVIAANPGDNVQITRIVFHRTEIVVDINGGSKKHHSLASHIQIGFSRPFPVETSTTSGAPKGSPGPAGLHTIGATLVLDYGDRVPDLTPEQVKKDLSNFLDFGHERSAAVNWVDTLPPRVRHAIARKQAVVGMTHDEVLAAMGRPDQKVRERTPEGVETEDWIYGYPPEKTVFVTFVADKVVRVKQFF